MEKTRIMVISVKIIERTVHDQQKAEHHNTLINDNRKCHSNQSFISRDRLEAYKTVVYSPYLFSVLGKNLFEEESLGE